MVGQNCIKNKISREYLGVSDPSRGIGSAKSRFQCNLENQSLVGPKRV
jgi:hypothetical protein